MPDSSESWFGFLLSSSSSPVCMSSPHMALNVCSFLGGMTCIFLFRVSTPALLSTQHAQLCCFSRMAHSHLSGININISGNAYGRCDTEIHSKAPLMVSSLWHQAGGVTCTHAHTATHEKSQGEVSDPMPSWEENDTLSSNFHCG